MSNDNSTGQLYDEIVNENQVVNSSAQRRQSQNFETKKELSSKKKSHKMELYVVMDDNQDNNN